MKRDLDLWRKILLKIDQAEDPRRLSTLEVAGFSPAMVAYNLDLLIQQGLVDGRWVCPGPGLRGGEFFSDLKGLTPAGEGFLNEVRDEDLWRRTKAHLGGAAEVASVKLIKAMARTIRQSVEQDGPGRLHNNR